MLLPRDLVGRERAIAWVFAALNSVEASIQELVGIDLFHAEEAWTRERRPQVEARGCIDRLRVDGQAAAAHLARRAGAGATRSRTAQADRGSGVPKVLPLPAQSELRSEPSDSNRFGRTSLDTKKAGNP